MSKDNLKRDINLFESIFKDKTKKTRDMEKDIKTSLKIFAGVACAAAVFLGINIGINVIRVNALLKENDSLATPEFLEEVAANKALVESLKVENQMLKDKLIEFESTTKLTIQDINDIAYYQTPDVTITGISYTEGCVKLRCQGTDELTGADFAQNLRSSGKFEDVVYTGVTKASENVYTVEISIYLHSEVSVDEGGDN